MWRSLDVLVVMALVVGAASSAGAAKAETGATPAIYCPLEGFETGWQFGTIATLPDGRIFTWYVAGKSYWEAIKDQAVVDDLKTPQKALGRFSSDGGRTWSEPQLLFEFPHVKGVRIAGTTLCDRDGILHIFGLNYVRGDWETHDPAKFDYRVWHAQSADMGRTWSQVRRINHGHTTFGWMNSVIQLSTGRIVMPLAYLSTRRTGKFVATCIYSDDGAKTWHHAKSHIVVDSGRGALESGACEPVIVELNDGRLWMSIRTQTGYQYQSFSEDGGETWSEPVQSRFISTNSPVQLLRLRDGRIVIAWNNCTFGNLEDFRGDRVVMCAAISEDDGKTWHGYREVARRNKTGIIAYPYMTETTDGTVLIYNWGGDSYLMRLDPDWLMETSLTDDFSGGLSSWATMGTEGVTLEDHPDKPGRKVLVLRKTNPEKATAAVRNFPFGVRGRLTLRLKVNPGFKGARLCLTDFFSLPPIERKGRFGMYISPNGWMYVMQGNGEDVRAVYNPPGKWFTLSFLWDCSQKKCELLVNGKKAAVLWQLLAPDLASPPPNLASGQRVPEAYGLCYLRIWSTAEETDEAGMMVESLKVRVAP